jgi:hypothetical protein
MLLHAVHYGVVHPKIVNKPILKRLSGTIISALVFAGASSVMAAPIYSTLGPEGSYSHTTGWQETWGASFLSSSYYFTCPEFTVPGAVGQRVVVTSIDAIFEMGVGTLPGYRMNIQADNNGVPGAIVGGFTTSSGGLLVTFSASDNTILAAGSRYWLVPDFPKDDNWDVAWNWSSPEVVGDLNVISSSGNSLVSGVQPAYQINGSCVPEGGDVTAIGALVMLCLIVLKGKEDDRFGALVVVSSRPSSQRGASLTRAE